MRLFLFLLVSVVIMSSCNNNVGKVNSSKVEFDALSNGVSDLSSECKNEDTTLLHRDTLVKTKAVDPFPGKYFCYKTKDTYMFYEDHSGYFSVINAKYPSDFEWQRCGSIIKIKYVGNSSGLGEQSLIYENKVITEKSPNLGTLVFEKVF